MAHCSKYIMLLSGVKAIRAIIRKAKAALTPEGKVDILQFTDNQYKNIVCFRGSRRSDTPKNSLNWQYSKEKMPVLEVEFSKTGFNFNNLLNFGF